MNSMNISKPVGDRRRPSWLAFIVLAVWHVRSRDAYGNPGPWSETRTLTVAPS